MPIPHTTTIATDLAQSIRQQLSTLVQNILDNDLTTGQAASISILADVTTLNVAIQAATNLTDLQ